MSVISHLSIELKLKLTGVETELSVLLARIARGEPSAELVVRTYLSRLRHGLERKRASRLDAEAEVRQWQREQGHAIEASAGEDTQACGSYEELKERAARARRCAFAAMELAAAAIDEATCVALESWLAETDAAEATRPCDEACED